MKKNNIQSGIVFIFVISLFVIYSLNYLSATFTVSNPQTSLYNSIFTGASSNLNTNTCQSGQDFIVQISPSGCTPTVVRSDLLSQQDVPVFCPLSATQINPLINVKAISGISFSGGYSKYVQSVGFYPAQAALNLNGQVNNYPVLSTVGYVVIDLKQMPNESAMPSFVQGNLTATISYNAQNALGIGTASLYLPQLSDSDWQSQYPNYGFWGTKGGYVRATNIQGNTATISVYDTNLNQISTFNLQAGQTSGGIAIPGFNYCSGTMQVTLNSLQNANTRAKLEVNGNVAEVAQGENLLNNQCQVLNIQDQGEVQDAQIGCNTDSGRQIFDLRLAPRVTLNINGQTKDVGLGDYLYNNGQMSVYLGYIGNNGNSVTGISGFQNLRLVLIELPNQGSTSILSNDQLNSIASLMNTYGYSSATGNNVINDIIKLGNIYVGTGSQFIQQLVKGQQIQYLDTKVTNPIFGTSVSIVGFSSPQDTLLSQQEAQNYQSASSDYQSILNSYPTETYPSGSNTTLGEQALYQQIQLALKLNQKNTLSTLCNDFKQRYPYASEDTSFCNNAASLSSQGISSQYISINGQSYLISLEGIDQPTFSDFGAVIDVKYPDGTHQVLNMIEDQSIFLNSSTNEFMQLVNLGSTSSTIAGGGTISTATVKVSAAGASSDTKLLQEGIPMTIIDPTSKQNYILTLESVNLRQYAQVTITPKINTLGSQANFSFNIGVEKSAVQLTPDQIQKQINQTNASIAQWQAISNATGKVVSTLSTACLATGTALVVKNFIEDLSGAGVARQAVMTGVGGWNQKCTSLVSSGKYSTQEQCFNDNSDQIDSDVNQMNQIMNQVQQSQVPYTTTQSSFLGGSTSNTNVSSYLANTVESHLNNNRSSIINPDNPSQNITISAADSLLSNPGCNGNIGVSQATSVDTYAQILNSPSSSQNLKTFAQQNLYSTLLGIQANSNSCIKQQTLAQTYGVDSGSVIIGSPSTKATTITNPQSFSSISTNDPKLASVISSSSITPVKAGDYYALYQNPSTGQTYLIDYNVDGVVQNTYIDNGNGGFTQATDQSGKAAKNPENLFFSIASAGTYQNQYKNPQVQYFATAPYQGMPAIVPFDTTNGWYAAVEQTLPMGGATATQSYTAAGQVQSFYLCNVGSNGLEEGIGMGDDICEGINLATNQLYTSFPGLDQATTQKLITEAESAIKQAETAYQSGVSSVVINGQKYNVGQPTTNSPAIQCTDFMSPSDCNLLFNLCDPVVCPPSRCNFGGAYPVQDVVQTGVIGSTLLCLPNAREGIAIPVCLTGIKAGIDNWVSIQQAYEQCLQDQLNTGQTTGICSEVESVYECNFFWEQAAPLANLAVPAISNFLGQANSQGGGEYLNVQNALSTTRQSVSYLMNSYGVNSFQSLKSNLTTLGIGTTLCQEFISLTVPNGASIASQLANPDSPPQFTGTFQEMPYTTATVPSTSQYQVYYHIYAGANQGVYYSVYLQRSSGSTGSSYYQGISTTQAIDSGYIAAGNFTDQTKDLTAPSGYNQMCINVNGQTDCGFQQVSTSLAVNYLQNQYVSSQVNNTQITTESSCVSGTPNVYSLLNPNAQNGLNNAINPQIYNQGIVRVCATSNPGIGTNASRWTQVGTCGTSSLGCWLDTQSVSNVLTSPDIGAYLSNGTTASVGSQTLQSLENNYNTILQGTGYLSNDQFDSEVQNISSQSPSNQIITINGIINKVFYNNQKAELLLLRGGAYGKLAISGLIQGSSSVSATTTTGSSSSLLPLGSSGGSSGASLAGAATGFPLGSVCTSNSQCQSENCLNGFCSASYNVPNGVTAATLAAVMTPSVGCNCGTNCQEYAQSLINAANTYNEDPVLLLSIMIQESNCQDSALSPQVAGQSSTGLMQIYSYNLCSSIGVNSLSDVSSPNDDKNIQCGALILKDKYNSFSGSILLPSSSQVPTLSYNCDGVSATYTGWDAALRGYAGTGCNGNSLDAPNYVNQVDTRYNTLMSILLQNQASSSSAQTSNAVTSDEISNFNQFKSIFDSYSKTNLPNSIIPTVLSSSGRYWTQADFESLLVAIAEENNWGGSVSGTTTSNGDWLMGYSYGNTNYQSGTSQVNAASAVLSAAITGNAGFPYNSCNKDINCVLSVYNTGKTNSNGFLGIGANTQGINYANNVISLWSKWDAYLSSQIQ